MRIFPDAIKAEYPLLAKHFDDIAAAPGVKEYLASDRRLPQVCVCVVLGDGCVWCWV